MRTRASARLAYSPPVARPNTTCWSTPWTDTVRNSSVAKVRAPHRLVLRQLRAGAGDRDLAHLEHVRPVGHPERGLGVLLDEQDGHALLLVDLGDDLEDGSQHGGGQAQR